jgi:hypothetical protein
MSTSQRNLHQMARQSATATSSQASASIDCSALQCSGVALSEPHRGRVPVEHRRACFDLAIIHELIDPIAYESRTRVDATGSTDAQGLLDDVD